MHPHCVFAEECNGSERALVYSYYPLFGILSHTGRGKIETENGLEFKLLYIIILKLGFLHQNF